MIEVDYFWSGAMEAMKCLWKLFFWSSRGFQENKNISLHNRHLHRATCILHWSPDNCWELLRRMSTQGRSLLSSSRNALDSGKKQSKKADITEKKNERTNPDLDSALFPISSFLWRDMSLCWIPNTSKTMKAYQVRKIKPSKEKVYMEWHLETKHFST